MKCALHPPTLWSFQTPIRVLLKGADPEAEQASGSNSQKLCQKIKLIFKK